MQADQEDFAPSALRHVRDAEHLLEAGPHRSRDQAWHLAGFAHECARKACLRDGWVATMLGHDFAASGERVIDVAVALDPRSSRFRIHDWAARHPETSRWAPAHRYERTGASEGRDVGALVRSAREAVDASVLALTLEGLLDPASVR